MAAVYIGGPWWWWYGIAFLIGLPVLLPLRVWLHTNDADTAS